ncbi:uncharacterized protein V1510DRAFT_366377 [Dipodascopsis tothii]|uniref:uncharacterized protein n=1 Tax=Dipodascopsis tothii TaxID=44089 RepID=UPI0034CF8691
MANFGCLKPESQLEAEDGERKDISQESARPADIPPTEVDDTLTVSKSIGESPDNVEPQIELQDREFQDRVPGDRICREYTRQAGSVSDAYETQSNDARSTVYSVSPVRGSSVCSPTQNNSTTSSVSNLHIIQRVNSEITSLPSISGTFQYEDESDLPSTLLRSQRRKLCIEELISTEESYMSGLRMLTNTYFGTLEACGHMVRDVSAEIRESARALVEFHQELLTSLHSAYPTLYSSSAVYKDAPPRLHVTPQSSEFKDDVITALNGLHTNTLFVSETTWSRSDVSVSSPIVAGTIGQLIQKKASISDLILYEQYCINYDNVIEILKGYRDSENPYQRHWSKGCENAANASQSEDRHADLTFASLAINPTVRIMKYRLILEELCRNTLYEDSPVANQMLQSALQDIKNNLNKLDCNHTVAKNRMNSTELWKKMVFEQEIGFEAQCLGRAVLSGALNIVWMVKDDIMRYQYMGCFLFKSYLVIANIQKPDKFVVKFLISLSCAKIVPANNKTGLQTSALNSWKVVFEYDFGVYEVLMTAASAAEANAWKTHILVQNCVANGEDYAWKFDASIQYAQGEGPTVLVPAGARPLWVANMFRHNTISGRKLSRRSSIIQNSSSSTDYLKTPIYVLINHFPVSFADGSQPDKSSTDAATYGDDSKVNYVQAKSQSTSPLTTSPSSDASSHSSSSFGSTRHKMASPSISVLSSYCSTMLHTPMGFNSQNSNTETISAPTQFVVNIKRSHRLMAQRHIGNIWSSDDLPFVTSEDVQSSSLSISAPSIASSRTASLARRLSTLGSLKGGLARRVSTKSISVSSLASSGFRGRAKQLYQRDHGAVQQAHEMSAMANMKADTIEEENISDKCDMSAMATDLPYEKTDKAGSIRGNTLRKHSGFDNAMPMRRLSSRLRVANQRISSILFKEEP